MVRTDTILRQCSLFSVHIHTNGNDETRQHIHTHTFIITDSLHSVNCVVSDSDVEVVH